MTAIFAHSYTHRLLLLLTITRIRVDTVGVNGWKQLSCFPTVHSFDAELAKIGRMCEHAIGGACLGAFTILENWKSCCDFSAAGRRPCGEADDDRSMSVLIQHFIDAFNGIRRLTVCFSLCLYTRSYLYLLETPMVSWNAEIICLSRLSAW